MTVTVLARGCVAVASVLVLAWLGVMERDERLRARGLEAAQPPRAPGDLARAETLLRRARLLNPDTAPDVGRALVARARGRREQATALLEDVVRREPDNLTAWGVLFSLAPRGDTAVAERALAAQRRLDPLSARRR